MKHIKEYRLFEATQTLTPEQVEWLDKSTTRDAYPPNLNFPDGLWSINPQTGLVDIHASFDCSDQSLKDFKGVRFGVAHGAFQCGRNVLESLDGAPREVKGPFHCSYNRLKSLQGGPIIVGGGYNCTVNQIRSLEGGPRSTQSLIMSVNPLTSLKGFPEKCEHFIGDAFSVTNIPNAKMGFEHLLSILNSRYNPPTTGEDTGDEPEIWVANRDQTESLIFTILPPERLDAWFRENPLDLDLLDEFPDVKAGVLRRTGLEDVSDLARAMRKGLI